MTDHQNVERRVGHLETKVAEIVTALGGLKSIMDEVKTSLSNSKPTMWVLIPSFLGFVSMLIAGVVAVTSIRGDIASLYAVKEAREGQLSRMDERLNKIEQRQWQEMERDRDFYRGREQ